VMDMGCCHKQWVDDQKFKILSGISAGPAVKTANPPIQHCGSNHRDMKFLTRKPNFNTGLANIVRCKDSSTLNDINVLAPAMVYGGAMWQKVNPTQKITLGCQGQS
jgi:hypothetical protein